MMTSKRVYSLQRAGLILLLVGPAFILFVTFVIVPVFQGAYYSLFRWKGAGPLNGDNFQGLKNFVSLFQHKHFITALLNNFKIVLFSVILQLPVAFFFALLIGRKPVRGSLVFRSIYFFPYVLTEIISGVIWKFIYNPQFGLLTQFSKIFTADKLEIGLLGNPDTAFAAVFFVVFWKYIGFHMILYIAGLQGVPKELEDAAIIDGASNWGVIWNVVIPSMRGTIVMSVFLSIIGSFNVFDIVWAMGQGGPDHATETLVTYLYNFGYKRFAFGYGSAVAIVIFLVCLIFNVFYQKYVVRGADK